MYGGPSEQKGSISYGSEDERKDANEHTCGVPQLATIGENMVSSRTGNLMDDGTSLAYKLDPSLFG